MARGITVVVSAQLRMDDFLIIYHSDLQTQSFHAFVKTLHLCKDCISAFLLTNL